MWDAVLFLIVVTLLYSLSLQTMLEDQRLTASFVSGALWENVVEMLGAKVPPHPENRPAITAIPLSSLLVLNGLLGIAAWFGGAKWIELRSGITLRSALRTWAYRGWSWLLLPVIWQIMWLLPLGNDWMSLLASTIPMWLTLGCGGWAATFFTLSCSGKGEPSQDEVSVERSKLETIQHPQGDGYSLPISVWLAIIVFTACLFAMNWQLYEGLQTPHGDSVMYEEHLWNLTHGKGFRSFLDYDPQRQPPVFRLFLGEHIQVVHVLLLPLYLLWPSHLLLEFCETLALASGAIAVCWIARRHTGSSRAAGLLAIAYLFYFPLHYLDIEIDFKTFRPICFGVPAVLFALDQWERGRLRTMLFLLAIALSAKEDYAMILAPLGLWIALCGRSEVSNNISRRGRWWLGGSMAVVGCCYLIFVIKFAIPYFRGGDVHYARYFPIELGQTPGDLVHSVLTNPLLTARFLFTPQNLLFGLSLVVPLGFVPLWSPTRLAVATPLFGVLCLNQIASDTQHHFHAPLIPIVFWAAAAGLARFPNLQVTATSEKRFAPRWALACSCAMGILLSFTPVGIAFWDSGSVGYWRRWYLPGERSQHIATVLAQIPSNSRVASTDYVHPRFTHYERSYDYSDYRPVVPDDTDYIVIDTHHRYSAIKHPKQVKEYRDHPEDWELLPDQTDGYFIILRRR